MKLINSNKLIIDNYGIIIRPGLKNIVFNGITINNFIKLLNMYVNLVITDSKMFLVIYNNYNKLIY
jgi:hypothetical protein